MPNPSVNYEKDSPAKILQRNKKSYFEYTILEKYRCGIVLHGHEVKSIREQKFNFSNSFARVHKNALFLHNFHITPYKFYTYDDIDPIRVRVLLAKKKEIYKMQAACERKGHTLIPLEVMLTRGLVKILLGLGVGKKLYDKKESIKARTLDIEAKRDIKRIFREHS